jgi:hypothetical protein
MVTVSDALRDMVNDLLIPSHLLVIARASGLVGWAKSAEARSAKAGVPTASRSNK